MVFKGYFFLLYSDASLEFPILYSNKEKKKGGYIQCLCRQGLLFKTEQVQLEQLYINCIYLAPLTASLCSGH